jgi:hypothetical protein
MMAIKLKSVFQIAANNIVSSASRSKGSLGTVKKEYNDIVKFLDLQKNQIESIKLPDKKKIAQLANINVASTFGTPGNLLGSLLGGGLDLAGFVGNMFPSKEKAGKSSPVKVKGNKMRFGGIKALGVLNSVFAGLDFYQGVQEGEGVGKAAAGAGASLAGSIVGGVLGSALGPLGTFAGASLGGMAGGWLGDRAYEGVTGTGNNDGVKQKLEKKIKAQEAAQKAAVQGGNFEDIISRFSSAVSKFEKGVASGLFGTLGQQEQQNTDDVAQDDYSEPDLEKYDDDTKVDYGQMGGTFESHIKEFREFRNKQFNAPKERFATPNPQNYQVRELGIWEGGKETNWKINPLADDTAYEKDVHSGAGHWENRAFDIPVPINSKEGDMVAEFWRRKGYKVIWKTDKAHENHVHVEVPKEKANEFFAGKLQAEKQAAAISKDANMKEAAAKNTSQQPQSQKKPEEFFKGTPQENIFKDAKLKEEFSGKAKTPEVKAAQNKYNEYVNQIKQQRTQQVSAQMVAPAAPVQVPQIAQYPSYSQSQFYIIDRPSVIAMGGGGGSSQPVNVPSGGGDEGRTATLPGPSEGEVVNSLIKTLLLTNLSAS